MELTASPQINELIRTANRFTEGLVDAVTLREAITVTDTFLQQMAMLYQQQTRFRERTPTFLQQAPIIVAQFAEGRAGLQQMAVFFENDDPYQLIRGLERLKAAFNWVATCLEALRLEEESFPRWSRSPYMNTLLRLAAGARNGLIPADALHDALGGMIAQHQRFAAGMDQMARTRREAATYQENRLELHALMEQIERGLVEAYHAPNIDSAWAALSGAQAATERLYDIQERFKEAEESARTRPCFRCGTANPTQNKHCAKCGGVMPPMPMLEEEETSTVDFHYEDSIRAVGHVQTELTGKLSEAARDVQVRRIDKETFRRKLEECLGKVLHGKREFELLPVPNKLNDTEREALEAARETMRAGIREMQEGIEKMRLYVVDGNPAHLEHGLESALSGADKVHAVQVAARGEK